jgi:cytochrome c oxidase assembly protein subunit 11
MRSTSNRRTGLSLLVVAGCMVGMSFAAVPLYRIFCQVTGFGGTPLRADAASERVLDETITVSFDASIESGMPWTFKPVQKEMDIRIGESGLAFYTAHNPTDRPVAGTAVFNVTPFKIGPYFVKIDCFCFTEQVLKPGETVDMPVTFYVDPGIRDDRSTEEVKGLTLSYTFYETDLPEGYVTAARGEAGAERSVN